MRVSAVTNIQTTNVYCWDETRGHSHPKWNKSTGSLHFSPYTDTDMDFSMWWLLSQALYLDSFNPIDAIKSFAQPQFHYVVQSHYIDHPSSTNIWKKLIIEVQISVSLSIVVVCCMYYEFGVSVCHRIACILFISITCAQWSAQCTLHMLRFISIYD